MAEFTVKDPPEFSTEMRMLETNDPGHANVFNPLLAQLLNNDAFLKAVADAAKKHMKAGEIHVTAQDKEEWYAKAEAVEATQSEPGLMSAGDKQKLDSVAENAEVNQDAFSNVKVGSVTVAANGKTATFVLEAGDNITITADNATKKITIKSNRDGGNADKLDGYHAEHFANADHAHDGRYYTKTESDNLLKQKAASSHSHNNYAQKAIYKDDGVSLERTGAVGSKSIALGAYAVKATGPNSFAAGWLTEATGDTGTTFGYLTKATGTRSFACGEQTEASGSNSHAEGGGTIASGYNAHAEGDRTTASGSHSHSEGAGSKASGPWSHAEGGNTTASGNFSHAEGYETFCDCLYGGHAEGMSSIAAPTQCWLPIAAYSGATLTVDTTKVNYIPTAMAKITAGMDILVWNDYYANKDAYKYQVAAVNVSAKTITLNTALPASNFRVVNAVIPAIRNTKQYYPGHAEGTATRAVNNSSHAEGYNTIASGGSSHAEGNKTTASGENSHAEGTDTIASGNDAHAEGGITTASGTASHSEGYNTKASGVNSHTEGNNTKASGSFAHAEGCDTIASNYASHAQGKFNVDMIEGGGWSAKVGHVFVVGNGIALNAKSNALSLMYDGTLKTAGTITTSTAADYAEFFEWLDNNLDAEDRVGHFVALDGDKVRIADSTDTYILGIVSGRPFVLGNGDCDTWAGMYLHDEFNREIMEPAPKVEMIELTEEVEREIEEIDEETGEVKITTVKETIITGHEEREVFDEDGNPVYEGMRPKLNPEYDYTQKYISRFDRPEWAAIGMLGVLAVYDDGSCQVNGYCKVADGGIATAVDGEYMLAEGKIFRGYRVIERVTEDIVKVIFR